MKKLIVFTIVSLMCLASIAQSTGVIVYEGSSALEDSIKFKLGGNPKLIFTGGSTGIAIKKKEKIEHDFIIQPFDYENTETVFIINGQEVLRFFEDSIIVYFKGKKTVIKGDSLCNLLNEITKETFKYTL